MDAIKEEPDSKSETDECQVNEATEPFAFAAVKVEVKVEPQEVVEVKVEPDIEVGFQEYHADVNAVRLMIPWMLQKISIVTDIDNHLMTVEGGTLERPHTSVNILQCIRIGYCHHQTLVHLPRHIHGWGYKKESCCKHKWTHMRTKFAALWMQPHTSVTITLIVKYMFCCETSKNVY
ncbi:uncharacterized protein LOC111874586 isoform X3 [Cryptotermes secundus]|uniref:uncharacterized protein LOC111874586 isoform X3 n=1 Tax=Cryptotermes secundus TaxID=105785 RepID=UPI000CD7B083|nr:uncharacterized protein LOC111874586 isoform X3 [Cryptotermes secundus]